MSTEAARWEPAPFVLSFRLGEITLFRRRFRGLALLDHFFKLGDDPAEPRPPFERLERDVDVIVTRSHPIQDSIPDVSAQQGVLRYVFGRYTRFHTQLGGDFAGYLAKFSPKSRSTLRRKVRRFVETGPGCEMRVYKEPSDMQAFHRLASDVSALTYQEKLLDAGLPGEPAFVDELTAMAARDAVRAYVLFLQGKPIAYLCCPIVDGVLLYSYLGYDPKHADRSPGTVLQYLVFESLFAEQRFVAFDFTEGQGEHKKFFGTQATPCADICYLRDSLSARFWIGLHRAFDRGSIAAAALLESVGLKARLKRFFRQL